MNILENGLLEQQYMNVHKVHCSYTILIKVLATEFY